MNEENVVDVIILGGGPTGLFTAFYGGMRQMSVKIIDSMPQLGGQLSALYPEKYIYDVAGCPKILAQDLVDDLTEQANQFDPEVALEESVKNVEKLDDQLFCVTTDKDVHYSKTVIITAGIGAFQPRRLKMDQAAQYEGKNLHYFVQDLRQFKGQRVLLAGGGDSAVDWALTLEDIAEEVTLVHRRDKFRAHETSVEQLNNSSVKVRTPYNIKDFVGDEEAIHQVILQETKGDLEEVVDVDSVIVNYGFISALGPIKDWGLEIEKNSIVVNSRMETNIEGIYAAGDITTYDGKVKLIVTGFGEAPVAISHAKARINPKSRVQPAHSTSLF
ncbi:NAD(P)/FAD-dependent oxidoreductase [Aquibacillus sp. 3ASR75-11]|uniref:Ferredoxin--NADP reductase n=1 Tax=Terrihalobacillus insolitus TaxID=2950438 RepID=A0A9X4AKI4_9BACI|nr:NAD(P)/FAD-dependent oxidoreductase [Terrihalobacillus insolitus]MDC3411977.1 NAD(P)/FAD-dependent oxidoreductase [Terrihalobacillus insolitus]MDC3423337.1 NAD(P)/FAD-dependent oxidoreductase [Terrihalobacillus insolitus]